MGSVDGRSLACTVGSWGPRTSADREEPVAGHAEGNRDRLFSIGLHDAGISVPRRGREG